MSQFHTQGPVPLDAPAYVERDFEQETLEHLLNQRWVLLLGPREHGKSTGIARIKRSLVQNGLLVVSIDLQRLPPCESYEELLDWVANHAARSIGATIGDHPSGDESHELLSWLETFIDPGETPVLVIIDEAANIADSQFRNSFYGQIRGIASARTDAAPNTLVRRMRFLFSGMFRPESMVHPANSPFNVCERVETEDLGLEQSIELVRRAGEDVEADRANNGDAAGDVIEYVNRTFNLVGGHPYLQQAILSRTFQADPADREDVFASAIEDLKYKDMHTSALLSRVLADEPVARIAAQLAEYGELPMIPGDNDYKHICVLGLAKREGAFLRFRNDLYAEVARNSPQLRPEVVPNTPISPVVALPDGSFDFMRDDRLREVASSAQRGAANSATSGSYRLALVGFGTALEAILIDWLKSISATDLQNAVQNADNPNFSRFEDPLDPATWRLVNLMKVGRAIQNLAQDVDLHEALREFRNTVHPMRAVESGLTEAELGPEVQAASGLFMMVVRDVGVALRALT